MAAKKNSVSQIKKDANKLLADAEKSIQKQASDTLKSIRKMILSLAEQTEQLEKKLEGKKKTAAKKKAPAKKKKAAAKKAPAKKKKVAARNKSPPSFTTESAYRPSAVLELYSSTAAHSLRWPDTVDGPIAVPGADCHIRRQKPHPERTPRSQSR